MPRQTRVFILKSPPQKILRDSLYGNFFSEIKIENLGPVSWALKTAILRDRKSGILKISQEQFTSEFLAKEALGPRSKSLATSPNFTENFAPCDRLDKVDGNLKNNFQKDIGSFWWLAQISRPDIFYAVNRCAKLINQPTPRLGQRIKKIKDYLSATPSLGICFSRNPSAPTLSGFVDAARC